MVDAIAGSNEQRATEESHEAHRGDKREVAVTNVLVTKRAISSNSVS